MNNKLSNKDFLSNAKYKNCFFNFCANYYNLFLKSECNIQTKLCYFVDLLKWSRMSDESLDIEEIYTEEDYAITSNNVYTITKKMVDNLIADNPDEDTFYKELLNKVMDNILFSTDLEKVCAISLLSVEPRIPYFQLDSAMQMDNDKFAELSSSIKDDISKAYFILSYGYAQKTEVASQLQKLLDKQESEESKVVLLSSVLGYYNTRIQILLDRMSNEESPD